MEELTDEQKERIEELFEELVDEGVEVSEILAYVRMLADAS
jgi:hypothetical protein